MGALCPDRRRSPDGIGIGNHCLWCVEEMTDYALAVASMGLGVSMFLWAFDKITESKFPSLKKVIEWAYMFVGFFFVLLALVVVFS